MKMNMIKDVPVFLSREIHSMCINACQERRNTLNQFRHFSKEKISEQDI